MFTDNQTKGKKLHARNIVIYRITVSYTTEKYWHGRCNYICLERENISLIVINFLKH